MRRWAMFKRMADTPETDSDTGPDTGRDRNMIQSLSRAIGVLQVINRHGSLGLTQIAEAVDIPYPTASRIVNTLMAEGLLEREPARKRYRPTALIQTLSCGFQNHDQLINVARPLISAFTHAHHWPLTVVTRVGSKMVVRDSTSTQTSLTFNNYYPGWQVPLIASASGQVYFSYASDEEQEDLLRQSQARAESHDALLLADFESGAAQARIRKQGYAAVSRTPYSANPGRTSSFAIPLRDGDRLLGSLAMVYFANAMTPADAIARFLGPLRAVAEGIAAGMGLALPDEEA